MQQLPPMNKHAWARFRRKNLSLSLFLLTFLILHFIGLSHQEFVGDEASPMLSIDRMWDAFRLHDLRFLGYPFLFYTDPYRALFSGTLLHFFGPGRILERLPSIFFSLATYLFLWWAFQKERVFSWLRNLVLFSLLVSSVTINDRFGGGDAQVRFLFLVSGYFLWKQLEIPNRKSFLIALFAWMGGMLTMLDVIALIPMVGVVFLKARVLRIKKVLLPLCCILLVLLCYFLVWGILPYLAYRHGFQHYLSNRGLFYYFSRASEGVAASPFTSIQALINFTSPLFALWVISTMLVSVFLKPVRSLLLISGPALLIVIALNRSSFHVIMYLSFFTFHAGLTTHALVKRHPILATPLFILCTLLMLSNFGQLSARFLIPIISSPHPIPITQHGAVPSARCLDEAAVRIYTLHHAKPTLPSCDVIK